MAYRFDSDEGVRSAFVRCADEQLDRAVSELTQGIGEDPVEAVHAARKAIKKERSLLRLARASMDSAQRRRENAALRDVGRSLSTARDAEVMLDTLEQLSARYVGQLPETVFAQIHDRLRERRDRERAELAASSRAGRAADELQAVRARHARWRLARGGWPAIERGLQRSYRDGRALFSRARSERGFEGWHAWRKRAKDLWYQERLLAPAAGPSVAGHAKDAHRLADALGDDHDLGVLEDALRSGTMTPPVDLDAVLELIGYRRRELQAEALRLGARIYAESPKQFIRRIRSSWEAGRALAREGREQDPAELAQAVRAVPAQASAPS